MYKREWKIAPVFDIGTMVIHIQSETYTLYDIDAGLQKKTCLFNCMKLGANFDRVVL